MSMSLKTTQFILKMFSFVKYSLLGSLKNFLIKALPWTGFKKCLPSQALPKICTLVNRNLRTALKQFVVVGSRDTVFLFNDVAVC